MSYVPRLTVVWIGVSSGWNQKRYHGPPDRSIYPTLTATSLLLAPLHQLQNLRVYDILVHYIISSSPAGVVELVVIFLIPSSKINNIQPREKPKNH